MPSTLTTKAVEKSTYIVTAAFTDDDGVAVVPNTPLTWTLTDRDGAVINNRDAVAITPAASVEIVLSGDDLAVPDTADLVRYVTIEGTYDSDAGSNLPIKDQVKFAVSNLVAVT